MAGFKRNHKYDWKIDLGNSGYCEFKATPDDAHDLLVKLNGIFEREDSFPMYCNGKLT